MLKDLDKKNFRNLSKNYIVKDFIPFIKNKS